MVAGNRMSYPGEQTEMRDPVREAAFLSTPLYVDRRGYVWQRLRNGQWHSTDCVNASSRGLWQPAPDAPEHGPYTMLGCR